MFYPSKSAPNVGLEPTTLRLRVSCSTDWASRAVIVMWKKIQDIWILLLTHPTIWYDRTRLDQNYILYFCHMNDSTLSSESDQQIWAKDVAGTSSSAVVAEWLRRLTRNQFPSGSAGSNPADCDNKFWIWWKKILETGGIDPPTSHMLSERSTIWATSPPW